jgi:hypothetical protein
MATNPPADAVSNTLRWFSPTPAREQLVYLQNDGSRDDKVLKEFFSSFLLRCSGNKPVPIVYKTELHDLYNAFHRVYILTKKAYAEVGADAGTKKR